MRPISDKEEEAMDLDLLFEEYVETDMLHRYSDSTADPSSSNDLTHFFTFPSSNESDVFITSSILNRDESAWQKAVNKLEQNLASSKSNDSSSYYIGTRGKESLSDSELLSFEDLFELERNQLHSISQPSTPQPRHVRSVKKAVSFQDRSISRGVQKSLRKSPAASFAKMMHPSVYRSPIPDIWARKMDTTADSFGLHTSSNGISSPPLSSKLLQHDNGNGFFTQEHQPYSTTRSPLASPDIGRHNITYSNYQLTPHASPAIGISNNVHRFGDNMGLTFSSSANSSEALSALQTPPLSLRLSMTAWGPETSPGNLGYAFSASPDFAATKTADWWDNDGAQPAANPTYNNTHSRSTSQNMSFSSETMAGLGISCDNGAYVDFAGLGISNGDVNCNGHRTSAPYDVGPYTTMYPTPPQQHIVSIGNPISRTPSPCPQPRFHRRRPSSQTTLSTTRRKSSNTSQHPRQASIGSASGQVGFVNFTPEDKRKILTGVAPSGSSKTKARREKEAADKRKKLSQAAVKAVMEAGGDVDSLRRLEREGLMMLDS
jgi:hypothetical protein